MAVQLMLDPDEGAGLMPVCSWSYTASTPVQRFVPCIAAQTRGCFISHAVKHFLPPISLMASLIVTQEDRGERLISFLASAVIKQKHVKSLWGCCMQRQRFQRSTSGSRALQAGEMACALARVKLLQEAGSGPVSLMSLRYR